MLLTDSSTDILKAIAIKASNLSECLNAISTHEVTNHDLSAEEQAEIESRLELWCEVAAKGDREKFHRRLVWDGLSEQTVRWLVIKYDCIEPLTLPVWTNTLKQVIAATQEFSSSGGKPEPSIIPENPIPFADFYIPCLQVARNLLKNALPDQDKYTHLITSQVQTILESKLLESLCQVFAPTLMQEFNEFRRSGNPFRDFFALSVRGSSQRDKYQGFIHKHCQDGLLSLFEKYSVLGRLVAMTIEFWVESTSELLNRLVNDWSEIQEYFSPHEPLSQVVDIAPGLSDGHKRGRTVAALTFDTGLKVVYKPRDIGLEVAFGNLVQWCNQQGIDLKLKSPKVLNYSTHGWVEYIESLPCDTEEEVRRFYQRSGMLMCLIHILEGKDCHYENLIACGEYPVLIDMETLLHPEIENSPSIDSIPQISQKLADSVLRTALLPAKEILIANELMSIDMSGLGKVEEQTIQIPKWRHINTDGMKVDYETVKFTAESNVPTLNGTFVEPKSYITQVVSGFEHMYRWLMKHREYLLCDKSPLMQFADQECRLVFRNTRVYDAILRNLYHPDFMEVGMARSVKLDVLSRGFLTDSHQPEFWGMLAAEKQDMEQMDIPMFRANTSSRDLHLCNGNVIHNLLEKSSFERVIQRVKSLDETDLMFQSRVIAFCLCSRFLEEPHLDQFNILSCPVTGTISEDVLTQATLLTEAVKIARTFEQNLLPTSDQSIAWLGMGYDHSHQNFYIQDSGLNLYDGCVGVSLFLAALAKVTGDSQWRDLSLKSLHPLRQVVPGLTSDKSSQSLHKELGIGGAGGIASIIYGLVRISDLLDEHSLLDEAHQFTALITPEQITNDKIFDVVGGTAGTILGLLSLFAAGDKITPSPVLELAIACGEHLLNHQTGNQEQPRTGKTSEHRLLTGFSQGAAGIAYALLRLYAVTQDYRWLAAAQEAIAYEQTMFSPEQQNWLDLRSPEPKFQVSWAHGAAGIALARLGGLSVLDTVSIREQITTALETTQKYMIWGVDSLCWGNFGRIETLLVAAQILNCPNLLTNAYQATALVLKNAHSQGRFTLCVHGSPHMINPGFFQGLSGIGYQLLRLAYSQQLPSVLLWE